jgi:uncharacterized NAD-dependent epimerase/dehydratase family protein
MVILTEGRLNIWTAKTAVCVMRYLPEQVCCVLDSKAAGQDPEKLTGAGRGIPIVATLKEALCFRPNTLLIGIAPVGGRLPEAWRRTVLQALAAGLDLISGLHFFLGDDPVLARAARRHRRRIWDVRRVPDDLDCSRNVAKDTRCRRILTVGSDANLGKMTVALELALEARRRGHDAEFVATGQTGIVIAGSGICVDRPIADFINGAAERLVMERRRREMLFIEGQGSIGHPAYSGVALGLLHGCAPDAMVLCHCPTRKMTRSVETPIAPLPLLVRLHEELAGLVCRSKVVGVALNTWGMEDAAAVEAAKDAERQTGLPATDVFRFGCGKLMDALERHYDLIGKRKGDPCA